MQMTFRQLVLFISLGFSALVVARENAPAPQYSGINNIQFHQSEYNNPFAGNGFLLQFRDKVYGITVKHTLFEAKTKDMKNVEISPWVEQWRLHPNHHPEEYVLFGELLNSNSSEPINMKIMQKDWLVLAIEENRSSLTPVMIRETPVLEGEILTAYGCSYARKKVCQQDQITGEFIRKEGNNLRINMPDLKISNLRGLSGSPVLDQAGLLVGIVSNVLPSETNDGLDFAPASLDYLVQILNQLR